MTEDVNDAKEAADGGVDEKSLVVTGKKGSSFGVGGVGSLALAGLVLIVILTVLIVRSQSSDEDVLSFAPADSFYAIEIENIDGAADVLESVPLWRNDKLAKQELIAEIAALLGKDSDILKKFSGNVRSVTHIESFVAKKPAKMLVLKVGNGWDIESYYRREYSKVATPVTFAPSMHGLAITRPDKSVFYLKKIANFVLLSENKELLLRSLAAYTGDELSLAQCGVRFGDGEDCMPRFRLYMAINSFLLNYPEYKTLLPEVVSRDIAGDSAFLYEATLNATGFVAEGKFIRNEAAGYASGVNTAEKSGGGILATIFRIILIIVIILIALPILFIAFTLLLALYFFIVAWWKGELVPIDPPLKDLSPNLKEDLGVAEKTAPQHAEPESGSAPPAPESDNETGDRD